MPTRRLEMEGRHPDPAVLPVHFDGQTYGARAGETWGMTLLAHGVYVLGRSSKYHRPRGMFCGVGSCGQCVARVDGLPNVRLCQAVVTAGGRAESQNTLGTARFDALAVVDWVFYRGLDHHHLMTQAGPLNRVAVTLARQLGGLGRLPRAPGTPYDMPPARQHVHVAVVGGGAAGRAVAAVTRHQGLNTWVLEAGASAAPDVLAHHRAVAFYDDQELLVRRPRGLLRLRADCIVLATGGYELPPPCPGNDLPGVLAGRAARAALHQGILPGRRVLVAVAHDADPATARQAAQLAHALRQAGAHALTIGSLRGFAAPAPGVHAGAEVLTIGSLRGFAAPDPHAGAEVLAAGFPGGVAARLVGISGAAPHLEAHLDSGETVFCDAVVWCARPLPAHELARQMGVDTPFDADLGGFVPTHDAAGATSREGVFVAGELAGAFGDAAAEHGAVVGAAVSRSMRRTDMVGLA